MSLGVIVEIIGTIAAALVLISYIFNDQGKLRTLNLLASFVFTGYGVALAYISHWTNGWATILLNLDCAIVHIVWLVRNRKRKKLEEKNPSDTVTAQDKKVLADSRSKASCCFDCLYGLPSTCVWLFDHKHIYVGTELEKNTVIFCPRFVPASFSASEAAELVGYSYRTAADSKLIVDKLKELGYTTKFIPDSNIFKVVACSKFSQDRFQSLYEDTPKQKS